MKHPLIRRRQSGFSLVELLVVVGIIAILAAVMLPMISNYLKHYKIRGAAQEVGKEIQAARGKAISKNVNFGLVFLTVDANSYRWVVEDDQNPADGMATTRTPLATLIADPVQRGGLYSLPQGVQFSQACPNMPGGPFDVGLRFNRLGSWCTPGTTTCPTLTGVGQPFIQRASTGAVICLLQQGTGLSRIVTVTSGGRVLVQP